MLVTRTVFSDVYGLRGTSRETGIEKAANISPTSVILMQIRTYFGYLQQTQSTIRYKNQFSISYFKIRRTKKRKKEKKSPTH